ncbi:LacI family DNA-binding transcriptional regulator [Alkalihalophilus lindianensis]|uniref:LacI family DNA-binding transcriptional regulator n=1 Tax=Alkalihalophilus lindianensis TaxID=1630542 RepID=A0ABU3X4S8_9BACI|nr:LacI family DNA-binding transcriptional regulator [Alkalihalophilus lindianensis]MDV2682897.1 LacI family DNA-binding transcriptional regulator [Alkalihalophilus lindianensis]
MKATIYDVAKKAGVSIATVSKVINNTGNMRESTRQRVIEIMKEMNYRPNMAASALTGKGTKTLGLLIPDISNPFFSEMARTIEDRAHELGMSVIICSTDENDEKEKKYVELLRDKNVDGFIVGASFKDKRVLQSLIKDHIPLVLLTHDDVSLDITRVSIDDFKGGYEATSHLLAQGHRNIAIIAEHAYSSNIRITGYKEAHNIYGDTCKEENILRTFASIENGRSCFNQLFNRTNPSPPTAIFACNDQLAIGVIQGAKEKGIDVPVDLSVIGFDNTILATTTVPGLTTISQPISEMGERTVDLLVEEIKRGESLKERVVFTPELIIRGTTSKVNKNNKWKQNIYLENG